MISIILWELVQFHILWSSDFVTIRTKSIKHVLLDHAVSVHDLHLALTYITCSSGLPYISGSV